MKVWEATVAVLRETKNPGIMWGDEGLCHLVADKLEWPHEAWKTSNRLLAALRKTPGLLIRSDVKVRGRWVTNFDLPEHLRTDNVKPNN
jgi:hypothetical protein